MIKSAALLSRSLYVSPFYTKVSIRSLATSSSPFVKHFFWTGQNKNEIVSTQTLESLCKKKTPTAKIIYEILSYSKNIEEANEEIRKMYSQHNIQTPELSRAFGTLFKEFQKNNEFTKAAQLYEISKNYDCRLTKRIYDFLLLTNCELGNTEECIALLQQMKKNSIYLKKQTIMVAVRHFCKADRLNEMLPLLKEFCDKKFKPDPHLYNSLIFYYINKNNLESAQLLFSHMKHHNVEPDKYTKPLLEFWLGNE